jgi:hypothetical protein
MTLKIPAHLVIPGDRMLRPDGLVDVVKDKTRSGVTLNERILLTFASGQTLDVSGSKLLEVDPR